MGFPLSVAGSFVVGKSNSPLNSTDKVRNAILLALEDHSDDVEIVGSTVISKPSFLAWFSARGGRGHPMAPFDNVRATVTQMDDVTRVQYVFSTRLMLKSVLLMALAVAVFVVVTSIPHEGIFESLPTAAKFAAMAIAWLFGLNYIAGAFRGPRWLKRQIDQKIVVG